MQYKIFVQITAFCYVSIRFFPSLLLVLTSYKLAIQQIIAQDTFNVTKRDLLQLKERERSGFLT